MNVNYVDPDRMPRPVASDLGLHYLPMSPLWDARHKWVIHFERCGKNSANDKLMIVFLFYLTVQANCLLLNE